MVAFIGAVICIIAAVHTGSSKAAAQPPATDNQSLYTETAQTPPSRGSVPRAGSLGALHASESPEMPTFNVGVGVTGLTGHDPMVSRLICTPIPAGECNPKNFQQQAEDPSLYGGEDWGYLRTAAEELRQTVLQQKDQILTDQRTIKELTGKLSECEKGLDARGSSERRGNVAVRGVKGFTTTGHQDRIMVRDSPASDAESVHLLTVRTVDELEQAITQLKDRIDKLESDIGPFLYNNTDGNISRLPGESRLSDSPERLPEPGHVADAGGSWNIEDLEGELERKMELLEKERKALRLETQRHRLEIDQGINNIRHRLTGLEDAKDYPGEVKQAPEIRNGLAMLRESARLISTTRAIPDTTTTTQWTHSGLSIWASSNDMASPGTPGPSFPEGYRLSFRSRTNYMYAVVRHPVPKMQAVTACLWLRPTNRGFGTPLSYAVPEQPNELVLLQGLHTPTELLINDKVAQMPLNLTRGSWQHICVTWSQKGGVWQAYQGGKLKGDGHGLAPGHHIRPGGVLILGQEQDSLGGGFDSSQALVGQLSQVGLWNHVLTPSQVASLSRCGKVTHGSVAPWTEEGVEIYGGATKDPGEPCSKHTRSSQ